MTSGVEEEDRS